MTKIVYSEKNYVKFIKDKLYVNYTPYEPTDSINN